MNYYNASGQMDLSDRIAIETGICIGESFKKIAKRLRRHPSTIAHEVKENRTFIKGNYPNGKDCRMARQCTVRNLCGCDEEACNTKCKLCRGVDCTKVCDRYVSVACHKFDSPPYVCNNCKDKKLCNKDKYIYSAKFADAAVTRRRSESRQGVRLADEKKEELDELVTRLVKKNPYFDVVWSDKLGYIYLSGIAPDREDVCMAPLILRSGEDLCEEIIYNMAADILKQIGVHRDDPEDCSSDERKKIKEELKPYMDQLPEYTHLVTELFRE